MMTNAIAYVTETPEFSSLIPRKGLLRAKDDFFVTTFPNEVYLTIVADQSGLSSEYELLLTFTDKDGEKLQAEAERLAKEQAIALAAAQAEAKKKAEEAAAARDKGFTAVVDTGINGEDQADGQLSTTVIIIIACFAVVLIVSVITVMLILRRR